jgi:hypothetical protein
VSPAAAPDRHYGTVYQHRSPPPPSSTDAARAGPSSAAGEPMPPAVPVLEVPPLPLAPSTALTVGRATTWQQMGAIQLVDYSSAFISTVIASPLPANYCSAPADPQWCVSMADEYRALIDNETGILFPGLLALMCHHWQVDVQAQVPRRRVACPT